MFDRSDGLARYGGDDECHHRSADLPVMGKRAISFGHADELVERYVSSRFDDQRVAGRPSVRVTEVEGFRLRPAFHFDAIMGVDVLSQCDLLMTRNGRATLRFGDARFSNDLTAPV